MKKNLYAVALLAVLAFGVVGAKLYVCTTVQTVQASILTAYAYTEVGDYEAAKVGFTLASRDAQKQSRILGLFMRRSVLDKANETLATLPRYTQPDNQADLAVEVSRACAQLGQITESFVAVF